MLTLGTFVFEDFEIPESIPFGGEQKLTVKKLVGGARVIDAMGFDPTAPAWSGIFLGPNAMYRATTLKGMAQGAQVYPLTWDQLSYQVVIHGVNVSFHKPYYIPYNIVCEVVADKSGIAWPPVGNLDDAITADTGVASGLCAAINNFSLTSAMSSLSSAVSAVSSFASAAQSTINAVLTPLAAVQTQAGLLIASTEKTLMNVATVGGMLPNNPISQTIAQIGNYAAASQSQPLLVQLNAVLGRIGTNLGQVKSSVRTITVPGGNLFDIASKQYGDATGWAAIAQANPALKGDPQLNGITTLVIPPYKKGRL